MANEYYTGDFGKAYIKAAGQYGHVTATPTITTAGTIPTVNTWGTTYIDEMGEMSQIAFTTPTKIYVWKGRVVYYYDTNSYEPFYIIDGYRTYHFKEAFEEAYTTFLDTRVEIDLQYLADKLEGEK